MVRIENHEQTTLITMGPNQSASWRLMLISLIAISTLTLVIAIIWALLGVWFILPFAGLELGLLAVLLYKVNRRCFLLEILFVYEHSLKLELGSKRAQQVYCFEKNCCEFIVTLPEHSLSPAVLHLKQGEQCLRLGGFLNREDMAMLLDWVRQSRIPFRTKGKTGIHSLATFDHLE